ncbi:protein cornichon homolog 4 isoform X2 [Hydra vulgaris]|uniref:Protein cornichon homolog 4 isoform X2 n=1 Tax=Hydra vulgaris TaxID=6087 RepID=A0ABM4CID1_HYDVU
MSNEVLALIFVMADTAFLMFLSVYFIINLSDLECNYTNSGDGCRRLSKVVIPELIMVLLLCIVLVFFSCFGALIYILPMFVWLLYRILSKPRNHISFYDPAEIHNNNLLNYYLKESIVKLLYYLVGFFIFLYSLISTLVSDEAEKQDFVTQDIFR